MLEFSSEIRQEKPDAGRPALSESSNASRDSGDSSNRGGGGDAGGSLNDLRMPSGGEELRTEVRSQIMAESVRDKSDDKPDDKPDAESAEKNGENSGGGGSLDDLRMPPGGEQVREDARRENRPDGDAGEKPPDSGGSLDDLRMPPGGEQWREDEQRENRSESDARWSSPEASDAGASRKQETHAESQAAALRGLSDHPADDALKDQ